MLGNVMGHLLKKVVQGVQNKNKNNPNVQTANGSVFENILERFQNKHKQAEDPASSYTPAAADFCDDLCNDVNEAQAANVSNPNVETADNSVFNEMKEQLAAMKAQIAAQATAQATAQAAAPTINSMPRPNLSTAGLMAVTNSNKGSLGFRSSPDMGSAMHEVRIPEYSQLRVLEYSENSIILDGAKSRFAKVDFNGQQGWVLESYLAID